MFVAVPPECCLQPNNALQFFTGEGALPGDGGAWHRGAELRVYSRVQGLWGSGLSRAGLIGLWAAVGASLGMLQCSRVLLPKYRHDLGLLRSMIVHCYQSQKPGWGLSVRKGDECFVCNAQKLSR